MRRLLFILAIFLLVSSVSATTITINCSRDGSLVNNPADAATTWATLRNGAASTSATDPLATGSTLFGGQTKTTSTSEGYDLHTRAICAFNTSVIPDDATISEVTISLYSQGGQTNALASINASLIDATPASYTDFVTGDYSRTTFTRQATDIPYASIPAANGTVTFTLTNYTFINKTGYTAYLLTHNFDTDNISFTWSSAKTSTITYRSNTYTGIPYSPINMTVTYSTVIIPVASFTCTKTFLRMPNSVTCTDSSSNTPTSWNWNMGDGSAAITTQNVTYQYTKRGIWGISLNATNAGGSNITPVATNVKVIGYENYY
jgi:PKD repeat protein